MNELLLDTCALIWVLGGAKMAPAAVQAIGERQLGVSSVSALELGILMRKGRFKVETAPGRWFQNSLGALSATLHPMTPDILFASQSLPGTFHGDPFDRIMIATAHQHGLALVTRDRLILAYCKAQKIQALPC